MERLHNFRDFGGYPTHDGSVIKRGLLYRCGRLTEASPADLQELAALGIRTVCDLRTVKERRQRPDPVFGQTVRKSVHLPVKVKNHNESGFVAWFFAALFGAGRTFDYDRWSLEMYREYAADFRAEFAQVLRLAADADNLPILIHCSAGKDRTGFAVSLIQSALGAPFEQVMQDYLRTNSLLEQFKTDTLRQFRVFERLGVSSERFLPLFEARQEYLLAAFDQIHQDYATVDAYIRQGLGISEEERRSLRALLLEPAGVG
jgi:protein-tyrosine phosphatase